MTEIAVTPIELGALESDAALRLWLRPLGLMTGGAAARAVAAGMALPLAGSGIAFTYLEILARQSGGQVASAPASLPQVREWACARGAAVSAHVEHRLELLSARRPPWAGLDFDRPLVMGIVNVTPDSFWDGGAFADPDRATAHSRGLLEAGADILDIGGESTRPGAAPVPPEEELRRIEPVVRALAAAGAVISVDTRRASVMAAALACGARIINDVSALAGDPASLQVVARAQAPAVLMHMQGEPQTMQENPRYDLPSLDVVEVLAARIAACGAAGIPPERLVVDPGIGFGKKPRHNLEILARLGLFHALGCGILLGVSRKSLIGRLTRAPVTERLPGSLAGALHALHEGVQILRVHDVAETRQAIALWRAISEAA